MINIATYILAKQYVDKLLTESPDSFKGKSAFDIAKENGFIGTEQEWLESLKGITPHIGDNGNWFIGDVDTGALARIDVDDFYTEANLLALTSEEIYELCN